MAKTKCPTCGGEFTSAKRLLVHRIYKHDLGTDADAEAPAEEEPEAPPAPRRKRAAPKRATPKREEDGTLADTRSDAADEEPDEGDGLDYLDL